LIAASASFIMMEIVFWSGGLLVGKELFVKYKKQMNPLTWFRRKKQESDKNKNKELRSGKSVSSSAGPRNDKIAISHTST
jgi:hypothetical protein